MTTTAVISAQSIGTSTNVGEGKFPQKVTAQSISDRFFIEVKVTNGAAGYDPAQEPQIWYAPYSQSITADADMIALLKKNARSLTCRISKDGSQSRVTRSDCEPLAGGYIYLWCDIPKNTVAQTLTVNVIEGP